MIGPACQFRPAAPPLKHNEGCVFNLRYESKAWMRLNTHVLCPKWSTLGAGWFANHGSQCRLIWKKKYYRVTSA